MQGGVDGRLMIVLGLVGVLVVAGEAAVRGIPPPSLLPAPQGG